MTAISALYDPGDGSAFSGATITGGCIDTSGGAILSSIAYTCGTGDVLLVKRKVGGAWGEGHRPCAVICDGGAEFGIQNWFSGAFRFAGFDGSYVVTSMIGESSTDALWAKLSFDNDALRCYESADGTSWALVGNVGVEHVAGWSDKKVRLDDTLIAQVGTAPGGGSPRTRRTTGMLATPRRPRRAVLRRSSVTSGFPRIIVPAGYLFVPHNPAVSVGAVFEVPMLGVGPVVSAIITLT